MILVNHHATSHLPRLVPLGPRAGRSVSGVTSPTGGLLTPFLSEWSYDSMRFLLPRFLFAISHPLCADTRSYPSAHCHAGVGQHLICAAGRCFTSLCCHVLVSCRPWAPPGLCRLTYGHPTANHPRIEYAVSPDGSRILVVLSGRHVARQHQLLVRLHRVDSGTGSTAKLTR